MSGADRVLHGPPGAGLCGLFCGLVWPPVSACGRGLGAGDTQLLAALGAWVVLDS